MYVIFDVLGGHIRSHISVFAEMWNAQGKSLKAQFININSAKQDQGQYIPQESIVSKFAKKAKDSASQDKPFLIQRTVKSRN